MRNFLGVNGLSLPGHDVNEKIYEGVTFCCLVADEMGYLVVENVEVGYGGCDFFTPIPAFPHRGGRSFLVGALDLRLIQVQLFLMPCIVGEAVLD